MRSTRARVHVARAEAVDGPGGRRCAQCGDFIDPIDWCPGCSKGTPCRQPHRRLRKRADAAFCGRGCKAEYRNSYIRDCL